MAPRQNKYEPIIASRSQSQAEPIGCVIVVPAAYAYLVLTVGMNTSEAVRIVIAFARDGFGTGLFMTPVGFDSGLYHP